jgi:hypothetical protein
MIWILYFIIGLIWGVVYFFFAPQFDVDITKRTLYTKTILRMLIWPLYLFKLVLEFLPE